MLALVVLFAFLSGSGALYEPCTENKTCAASNAYCQLYNYGIPESVGQLDDAAILVDKSYRIGTRGQCVCEGGYVLSSNDTCAKSPELGDSCAGFYFPSCVTPYTVCEADFCVCTPGYEQVPGKKECTRTRKGLNQSCKTDLECTSVYTLCINGTCKCGPGFGEANRTCVPNVFNCPFGEALKDGKNVKRCKGDTNTLFLSRGWSDLKDNQNASGMETCPVGYSCIFQEEIGYGSQGNLTGHCCLEPKIVCPYGPAHPNATCDFMYTMGMDKGDNSQSCPMETHLCHQDPQTFKTACCARPCKQDDIYAENKCLPATRMGGPCESDAQCVMYGGVCTIRGGVRACGCRSDQVEVSNSYEPGAFYCSVPYCPTDGYQMPYTSPSGEIQRCNASSSPFGSGGKAYPMGFDSSTMNFTEAPVNDSCPAEHFCYEPYQVCCRVPQRCPMGSYGFTLSASPNGSCVPPEAISRQGGFSCMFDPLTSSFQCCSSQYDFVTNG